ncbi:hypothetical protein [Stutzerimonas tarimensis]|uniref:Lipoprotein n=1 Tax=Stutzerimonas tarimensis TaxID=1507735 RepID=A0ABV7T4A1_9GAMM
MKTTKDILKISGALLILAVMGCVPEAAYHVYETERDSFALNDKYLRVDPLDYPVFAIRQERDAPMDPDSSMAKVGEKRPPLKPSDRWEITHAFNGKYLAYSKDYDFEYCVYIKSRTLISLAQRNAAWPDLPPTSKKDLQAAERLCGPKGNGERSNMYIYLRPNGEAYGWQPLRNPKRHLFASDKVSWFREVGSGDWSGQPWFECVDRCEKLVNMVE